MEVREIWPEPRVNFGEAPEIPENLEIFQRKIVKEEETGSRRLRDILSEISEVFLACAKSSTSERKYRDVSGEVKKIAALFEESNRAVAAYREREAQERIMDLVRKQINKKQDLISRLRLKETQEKKTEK